MIQIAHCWVKLAAALVALGLPLVSLAQTAPPRVSSAATMPATQTVTDEDIDIQIFFPAGPPDARHLADLISKLYHLDSAQPDPTLTRDLGRLRSIAAEEQTGQLVAVGDRKALDHVHRLVDRLAIAAEPTTESKVY